MEPIRYAVVGLNHGLEHIAFTQQASDVQLVAICDTNHERRAAVAADAPDAKSFDNYDDLLTWGRFDAVILAVPPFLHRELGIRALQAGKHVFMEKPLADKLDDSRALRDAAMAAKTVFQVGYCVRSSPLIRRLRSMIQAGSLGSIVSVWFNMFLAYSDQDSAWRNNRATRGGKLFDCMPHYFDVMQLLADSPFERLTAFGHETGRTGTNADCIPTVASVMFEYANGAKGTHLLSEVTPTVGNNSYFGVAGTRGIVFGNPWDPLQAGSLECQLEDGLYLDTVRINGDLASRGHLGFREQHTAFLAAIRSGQGNPCTAQDAFEVDVIMEAIDQSLISGKTVSRHTISGD